MQGNLFITTKDRPEELAILCKSLLHSDLHEYIKEVIFLDDGSLDPVSLYRIYSSFSTSLLGRRVGCRLIKAKDGISGINKSLTRIQHYRAPFIWILNGDMLVKSNYFSRCFAAYTFGENIFDGDVIVSGFNFARGHRPTRTFVKEGLIKTNSVGGASILLKESQLETFFKLLEMPKMTRGWDLHIGELFQNILVTAPSASQHIGIFSGLNQLWLAGFPGAWAEDY